MAASNHKNSLLATRARELFAEQVGRALPDIAKLLNEELLILVDQPGSAREMQERRDAWMTFRPSCAAWVQGTFEAWRKAQRQSGVTASTRVQMDGTKFQLVDNDVMEDKILGSRLALRLLDLASWELNDLRLRIQNLEGVPELHKDDIFRPEVLARHLIEQWTAAKLTRELWMMLQNTIQGRMGHHLMEAYHAANEFLMQNGVMVEIDLRSLVKRTPSAVSERHASSGTGSASQATPSQSASPLAAGGQLGNTVQASLDHPHPQGSGRFQPGKPPSGADDDQRFSAGAMERSGSSRSKRQPDTRPASPAHQGVQDETRMQTATTPLARARMRAQGVMGHLKRLLAHQVSGFDDTRSNQASPPLAQAIAGIMAAESPTDRTQLIDELPDNQVYGAAHVAQAAGVLRQRSSVLKKATSNSAEKATIEIVALMFQSILAEDRIPAAVRVWFARLQMPVLRVAISEPEFFGSLQHPARRLIDRMGSCVLGFEVDVSGSAMEVEIKRVVQVIEQYPETGRRVFQLVYDEFEKFLSRFLSEQGSAARVVSVAQQVELKETMAIQYTIEMRRLLNDMPVREEVREFLFKIWAEVLAIAAVKNGPQHAETINLKRAAADLVWAASAKPNRNDRAKVIADLPKLLQLLRMGMTMLSISVKNQDAHIKTISDTLADAFMSKTDAISIERIDIMAKRLANLEDYLSDDDVGDLPLDAENLVMMIGIDATAADLEVITDGGSQPTEAMRAWAHELQVGSWFSLDHNGIISHVQFAWCSDRKQLHLFASADGRSFLIQVRRLAAYLQAGLLVPTEEEALTVRATREALAKLDANPERLLE